MQKPNHYTVSVVVPSYNGKHKISNLLNALSNQTAEGYEVIVVIDGSTDGTEEYLRTLEFKYPLRIHTQENRGRAAVRNSGARLAGGDLLIFFDDDMRPEPNCIEQHLTHHKKFLKSLMSGAQIDDDRLAKTAYQNYKCFLSNQWSKELRSKKEKPLVLNELHLTAANFSICKDIFEKLGGFDEDLKDAEDFDLAVRAFKQGYNIYYDHEAFAWHDDSPSCRSFIKRQREYLEYHSYLLKKKPELYHDVFRLKKSEQLNSLKQLFYSIWKRDWLINFTDKGYFSFLPRSVQYKMYDWIVASHVLLKK